MNVLFVIFAACFGSAVDDAYLNGRSDVLFSLYDAAATQADSLLVLYRLYPLTRDASLLDGIPEELEPGAAASELAILSALWAFRIDGVGPLKMVTYGRRSMEFLRRAMEVDRNDPFVLLSEGQSLFYRPGWAGGSKRAALQRFERLRTIVDGAGCGLSSVEAEMWTWFALEQLGEETAEALKLSILANDPPVLVEQFVTQPPS